jgi:hypothetical protein
MVDCGPSQILQGCAHGWLYRPIAIGTVLGSEIAWKLAHLTSSRSNNALAAPLRSGRVVWGRIGVHLRDHHVPARGAESGACAERPAVQSAVAKELVVASQCDAEFVVGVHQLQKLILTDRLRRDVPNAVEPGMIRDQLADEIRHDVCRKPGVERARESCRLPAPLGKKPLDQA